MEFLGRIGIDGKLLLAQIVNFGLLLWLLTKLVYKPIVKRIEKDEAELEKVRAQKEELERERDNFNREKNRMTAAARQRSLAIIKEAEAIARQLKKQIRQKAEQETTALIKQTRKGLTAMKPALKKEINRDLRQAVGSAFARSFRAGVSPGGRRELQRAFWLELITQLKKLTLTEQGGLDWAAILKKISLGADKKQGRRTEERKIKEIINQKLGPVVLEYALPLAKTQEKELTAVVSKKIGLELNIAKKQNRELISGFRLEIAGVIIESNLLNIVNNAVAAKK